MTRYIQLRLVGAALTCAALTAAACTASAGMDTVGAAKVRGTAQVRLVAVDVAEPAPPARWLPVAPAPQTLVISYAVEVRTADAAVQDAGEMIERVLEDPRGWQQADIDFQRRPDGEYLIVIDEGPEVQQLCMPYDVGGQFSCQNGPVVALNAIRWREGVAHWPGELQTYQTMLVNHEVGHLLGMHHIRCTASGNGDTTAPPAPVMEQQSSTLRGCVANPWPTPVELRLAATHQFAIAPLPDEVAFPQ